MVTLLIRIAGGLLVASFLPGSYGNFTYSYSGRVVGGFLSATGHKVTLLICIVGGLLVSATGHMVTLLIRIAGGFNGHMVTLLIRIAEMLLVAFFLPPVIW